MMLHSYNGYHTYLHQRIWHYYLTISNPLALNMTQHLNTVLHAKVTTSQVQSLCLQIGNLGLLLAFIAIICCFTHHPDIPKKYLIAAGVTDLGHIYATYRGLEDDYRWDVSKWNNMSWGSIGFSVFLSLNRWATVAGLFGAIGGRKAGNKSKTK